MAFEPTYKPWRAKLLFLSIFLLGVGVICFLFAVDQLKLQGVIGLFFITIVVAGLCIGGVLYRVILEAGNEGLLLDDEGIEVRVTAETKSWGKLNWNDVEGCLFQKTNPNQYNGFIGLIPRESSRQYKYVKIHNGLSIPLLGFQSAFLDVNYQKITNTILAKAKLKKVGTVRNGVDLYRKY